MKTRIISAIVALAIIIPLLIAGGRVFSFGVAVLSLVGYHEFLILKSNTNKIPVFMQLVGMVCVLLLVLSEFDGYSIFFGLSYKALTLTFIALLLPCLLYKKENYPTKQAFYLIGCTILIGLVFNCLILTRAFGINKFLYLLLITTITDTFAMIIGSLIGKHKLCPHISPNKSWEGSIAGSVMGTFIASFYYAHFINNISFQIIFLTLLLTILGQMGDLFFSKIKRENGIKDFSHLMPGHGGILDRLDSLIFVILGFIIIFC